MRTIGWVTLCLLTVWLRVSAQEYAGIHPAFVKLPVHFTEAWKQGEKDVPKDGDAFSFLNKYRRGIGDISVGFTSETVSFAWYLLPEWLAYYHGYEARRLYKSDEEIKDAKQISIPETPQIIDTISFVGVITLMPSFDLYGNVTRTANPKDLSDVRVVLKVGDRIIQPIKQPDNLLQHQGREVYSIYVPRVQVNTSTTSGYYSGLSSWSSFWGAGSSSNFATFSGTTTETSYYIERVEKGYTWYSGVFRVEFKIIDANGKPLITENDKEMTLIVIYGKNERHAKFKLQDLVNPLNSKAIKDADAEIKSIVRLHKAVQLVIGGDFRRALTLLNEIENELGKFYHTKMLFSLVKYVALIRSDEEKAYAYAADLLNSEFRNDAEFLNTIASIPLAETFPARNPNYDIIVRIARRACDLSYYQAPHILSTLAWALFKSGSVKEAIEHQEKAISIAKQQGLPHEVVTNLEEQLNRMKAGQTPPTTNNSS